MSLEILTNLVIGRSFPKANIVDTDIPENRRSGLNLVRKFGYHGFLHAVDRFRAEHPLFERLYTNRIGVILGADSTHVYASHAARYGSSGEVQYYKPLNHKQDSLDELQFAMARED